jgi:GrpB-like predicted nucleotidyltransferase (UPF0157 family)
VAGVVFVDLLRKNKEEGKRYNNVSTSLKAHIIHEHIDYIGRLEGTSHEGNIEHSLWRKH